MTLTIDRPESRNSLGEEGDGEAFAQACAQLNADREVRCAILTGAGAGVLGRRQCEGDARAGRRLRGRGRAYPRALSKTASTASSRFGVWRQSRLPLIAAVNGAAIGARRQRRRLPRRHAHCRRQRDLRRDVPEDRSGARRRRRVDIAAGVIGDGRRAAELFFTADTIDAATAQAWGLDVENRAGPHR